MTQNNSSGQFFYKALTQKMLLIVIIVSFTPMLLVSGFILDQFHVAYKSKIHAHLGELVQKHKQNIDSFLTEKLANIRFLSKVFSFEQLSDDEFLTEQLAQLQMEYKALFVDLGVVNQQGLQIAYAGPFKLGKAQYAEADWFKKAIENQFFISDVFLGLRGLPHFIVTVRNTHMGKTWILRATIDFMAFNTLVSNLRLGKTGFAFIVNRDGDFQTQPHTDVVPSKGVYREFFSINNQNTKKAQIIEKSDDSGKAFIYVASLLKNGEWLLAFQQEKDDALAELYRSQNVAILIIFMGGVVIIAMAYILSKGMVIRISKADREKEMMNQQVIETGKLASVGELAAGIAHEINNPVAIMVEEAGWIQDLLEDEEFRESENLAEFQRALKQINTQGKRCKEITHKLLSFARKTDSRVQSVEINNLIEDMVSLSGQRAKYSNVAITTHLDPNLPELKTSPTEMQQVFLNLINNALDAMDGRGGTITITSQMEGENLVIEVADNGPGIPRVNLARIFDPFYTTKPVGKGTGLGLSICYGIIKKMGGAIDVKSVVDLGTTFRITIPVHTQ